VAAGAHRKRLILELDPDSEPIIGCLRDAEGRTFQFTGWLGFSSALGQALQPMGVPPSASQDGPERAEDE
jgi:hypothetical protein